LAGEGERVGKDSIDREILEIALRAMSRSLDALVGACMDEAGKPKAPDYRELMRARGSLPPYCAHALARRPK
jgi:hypothetical protein